VVDETAPEFNAVTKNFGRLQLSDTIAAFDFDQAAKWDLEGKLTGTELDNRQQLELLMTQTIDKLLEEPFTP